MNLNPPEGETTRLTALANQAADYAAHMMRANGSVPPTVIADTPEGYVFGMPSGLADEAAKDRFAEASRMLVVAFGATAIAMILEAWVRLPDASGHLDTETPPSQAPDRREMVVVMVEGNAGRANRFLPILRDPAGNFIGFGHHPAPDFTSAEGRFASLMPGTKPSPAEAERAKAALAAMGFTVVRRDHDPRVN